jgi:hypothetical protein
MPNLAKVWNDGPTDYTEKFRDDELTIKKGGFIEMDRFDAAAFVSQYIKPIKNGDVGGYKNHKQLRVENLDDHASSKVEHRCMICKGLFQNENELALHSEAFHKAVMLEDTDKKKK